MQYCGVEMGIGVDLDDTTKVYAVHEGTIPVHNDDQNDVIISPRTIVLTRFVNLDDRLLNGRQVPVDCGSVLLYVDFYGRARRELACPCHVVGSTLNRVTSRFTQRVVEPASVHESAPPAAP